MRRRNRGDRSGALERRALGKFDDAKRGSIHWKKFKFLLDSGLQVLFDFILFILEDLKSTKAPK